MAKPIHFHTAKIGQAMASPVRLRALNLLAQRSWTVSGLAQELGESLASTSAHLKVLRAACLIVDEKSGRQVWCRVASPEVLRLLVAARDAAEALLPELREFVRQVSEDPQTLLGLTLEELHREVLSDRVILVDLRREEEFRSGRLPGSQSLPAASIGADCAAMFSPEKPIVAYCRGPYCAMAEHGVKALSELSLNVQRLDAGVVEWQVAGYALER